MLIYLTDCYFLPVAFTPSFTLTNAQCSLSQAFSLETPSSPRLPRAKAVFTDGNGADNVATEGSIGGALELSRPLNVQCFQFNF
jgi:hypothetical protein